MQYVDAWGKKLNGTVSQSKRSSTGQYLDDTGLLFYNARYYDPGIGRFVSADSIAPARENPQTRNRYSYVTNNPLKFTDPTGHCGKATDSAKETEVCDAAVEELHDYNIEIADLVGGLWASHELRYILEAIKDTVRELFGGDIAKFLNQVGKIKLYQSAENAGYNHATGAYNASAITNVDFTLTTTITFYQSGVMQSMLGFKRLVVHELAHAMDIRSLGDLSDDMMAATGSHYGKYGDYKAGGKTTKYGRTNHREDWAVAVAETVYAPPSSEGSEAHIDAEREAYVRTRLNP